MRLYHRTSAGQAIVDASAFVKRALLSPIQGVIRVTGNHMVGHDRRQVATVRSTAQSVSPPDQGRCCTPKTASIITVAAFEPA